jgi:hypothetical protein
MDTLPSVLGEVTTLNGYAGLIDIFRARFDELGITGECSDHLGGLASGHTTKLLTKGHMKRFGPVTLGAILGVLGVKMVITVDQEQLAQISGRLTPAKFRRWHAADKAMPTKRRPAKRRPAKTYYFGNPVNARLARAKATLLMSPMQRRRAARHAALVRWRRRGDRPRRQRGANPTVAQRASASAQLAGALKVPIERQPNSGVGAGS